MAQVNFRIDDETKRQAEELFGQMGFTMTSAIMVFIRQSINDQGIPFKISAKNAAYHEELLQATRMAQEADCFRPSAIGKMEERTFMSIPTKRWRDLSPRLRRRISGRKNTPPKEDLLGGGCLHEESLVRQGLGTVQRNHSDQRQNGKTHQRPSSEH